MGFRRPWFTYSTAEVDEAVERKHDRERGRCEARQDRLQMEADWCFRHRCLRDECECDRPEAA